MADRNGYIGRAPGDSSVVVARQTFSPTGIQTDFTFASGYVVGYLDLYLNGARLIEGQDFTATDGSVVGLTTYAQNGDVLELVAYKAFNATNVQSAGGDFSVGGNLSVTGNTELTGTLTVGGVEVQPGAAGTWASYDSNTGISTTKKVKIENNLEVTGAASTFSGDLTVSGVSTFTGNIDANGNVDIAGHTELDDLNVSGVSTFNGTTNLNSAIQIADDVVANFGASSDGRIFFENSENEFHVRVPGGSGKLTLGAGPSVQITNEDGNTNRAVFTNSGVVITGVATATSFSGDGSNLTGVGGELDVTSSLFI